MTLYRRSDTGQICTRAYAEVNPATTEKEEYGPNDCDAPYETPEGIVLNAIVKEITKANPDDTAELVLAGIEVLNEVRARRIYGDGVSAGA